MNDDPTGEPGSGRAELDALARSIADRLLARGPGAVHRMDTQMNRYAEVKKALADLSQAERPKSDAGTGRPNWEQIEWRRLSWRLHTQARAIADHLLAGGPASVHQLGPQVKQYAEVKVELDKLSYRVANTHSQSPTSPAW